MMVCSINGQCDTTIESDEICSVHFNILKEIKRMKEYFTSNQL